MFVVLRVITPEKSVVKRRRQRKRIERSSVRICPTEKGLPFFVLDILNEKRGIDWDLVAEKCGRYASRIIAPRNLPLPDHNRLKRFVPLSMNSLLIFNTAMEIIKAAALPPEDLSVTLTDRNAVHYSRVCDILPYASSVRVVTAHPERYASACTKAFEEFGASLIVRSCYEPTEKPDIVICCDGAVSSGMKNAAVITSKRKTGGKIRLCGSETVLSESQRALISDNIDPIDFAGALTELCGSPEYKKAVFRDIDISCTLCNEPSPKKCLACYCSGKLIR
ncbi:MAG: hypothetical protein IJ264_03235 [Clostridia bacterium]|nr:hypothetical protein [Clostridia bacterium]